MHPQLSVGHSFIEGALGELTMVKKSLGVAMLLFKALMVQHHDILQLRQEKFSFSIG